MVASPGFGFAAVGPARGRPAKYSGFTVIHELRTHSVAAATTDIPHFAASSRNSPAANPVSAPRFLRRTLMNSSTTSTGTSGASPARKAARSP